PAAQTRVARGAAAAQVPIGERNLGHGCQTRGVAPSTQADRVADLIICRERERAPLARAVLQPLLDPQTLGRKSFVGESQFELLRLRGTLGFCRAKERGLELQVLLSPQRT